MNKAMLDLYVDYLVCSTSYTTAAGLSRMLDGEISYDQVTRFLSSRDFMSADLWNIVKPFVRQIDPEEDSALIIDDSIEKKPYTDENQLATWHHDHKENRSVKGINFVTALSRANNKSIPVSYACVRKDQEVMHPKTKKLVKKASISKQDHYRNLITMSLNNGVPFKYVLNDSWFASAENMNFVKKLNKHFIMPLKTNRKVALSEEDKAIGRYVRIDSLNPH